MLLKQKVDLLAAALPNLRVEFLDRVENGQDISEFSLLNNVRDAVEMIEKTGFFQDQVKQIKNNLVYQRLGHKIISDRMMADDLKLRLENLTYDASQLLLALYTIVGGSNENAVYIKLPQINDFQELSKESNNFHQILSQLVLYPEINGQASITSVENGSIWLEVSLGSAAATALVGRLAWSAAVFFNKVQEGKLMSESVKARKLDNARKQQLLNAHEIILDEFIENEVDYIKSKSFPNGGSDNELSGRIKNSLKLLSEEFAKGAEIQPSLYTSKEIQEEFPDMKLLSTLVSKIKHLADGGHAEDDKEHS